ncbi:MAG: isoleucine--tRNA ligase [Candidatus Saccharimonadia bacterium]
MKKAQVADFPAFEHEMLAVWKREKTFEKSLELRRGAPLFRFYDGPPFANGLPHYGHVVAITEKDSVTRYKTMRGYYVPRRNGWDTHGLPVEFEVEKQLGISGKKQIEAMGIEKFNAVARASVFKYKAQWEDFMTRIGRWADKDAYATMDDEYIESVWWVLSELNRKGLVYRGFRCNPYCPRCATPLSNFELNQGYQDNVSDPSVYVKFSLKNDQNTAFLAWTTTPWTLPANSALAVVGDAKYVTVELLTDGDSWTKGEKLILAKARLDTLELRNTEYKVVKTVVGKELAGTQYLPLYQAPSLTASERSKAFRIYVDDSASIEDGTGVVHSGTRYGETDLALCLAEGLPLIDSVNGSGQMSDWLEFVAGKFFKAADPLIIEDLTKKGHIFAAETFTHTYPFCWRCETPLMYYSMPSWFVRVSDLRERLVANNNQINWIPEHIREGRFGNWLAEARDWNFSRNRYWGAPLPIWVNESDENDFFVIDSIKMLKQLSGRDEFDLHRPGIDELVIIRDGKTYKRVEEVFDCWFESGSMPYAQLHYPFEHKDSFPSSFPAEFIAEGLDQTRGWFYTLHVLGTALFEKPAFKNVIVHGMVLAADGKKLSKRLRNYPEPREIFEGTGADSLRYFLMSSPVENAEDVRFSYDAVDEVTRNVFMTLWNVYSFFSTYAEIDKWEAPKELSIEGLKNPLDQWLIARLEETITETTSQADAYQVSRAVRPLRDLIDDLSNWYVRRSRRRFWKSEDDQDKQQAYATLYYALVRITQLLAPWAPFISDKLWRALTAGTSLPSSVHLSDWPTPNKFDNQILDQMKQLREIVTVGLSARAAAGIKVRQPLQDCVVVGYSELAEGLATIAREELNIKKLVQKNGSEKAVLLNTEITQELKLEGLARDLIRSIQAKRKQIGLEVDDRINLEIGVNSGDLANAAKKFSDLIAQETLATEIHHTKLSLAEVPIRIGEDSLTLTLTKS